MTRRRPESRRLPLALTLALLAAVAQAQQGESGSGGAIRPRIGVSQSWTDNLRLSDHDKDAALITTISPGISIARNTGAVRGTLDYTLNGVTYLKTSYGTRIQNSLTSNLQAEVLPGSFYVDAQASIGQQSTSAFGLQSTPNLGSQGAVSALDNPNRIETGTLSVSPLLRGQLGGIASVDLRGNFAITEARGSALGDSRGSGGTLRIAQLAPGALSWYAQLFTQQAKPKTANANRNTSLTLGTTYRPDPDWVFTAQAGRERHNYLSAGSANDQGWTGGLTADWTPTPRTRITADYQRHSYANSHGLSFEHRMRSASWRIADTRNITLGNTGATGGVRTNYDLYFLLFASLEPDPVARDARVRAALQALGLSPEAPASLGFLSTGPSQLHNQMLMFTVQGVRSNVTANISRSVTSRLGSGLNQGDLSTNAYVEQRSYSVSASYQLSQVSGLSLTASRQETLGEVGTRRARLSSLMANWTARLGTRLNAQLGARHSQFDGVTSYAENAAYANLTQQF